MSLSACLPVGREANNQVTTNSYGLFATNLKTSEP